MMESFRENAKMWTKTKSVLFSGSKLVHVAWNWLLSNVLPSKSLISSPVYTGFVDPQNLDGSGDGRTGCVDEQVLELPCVAID